MREAVEIELLENQHWAGKTIPNFANSSVAATTIGDRLVAMSQAAPTFCLRRTCFRVSIRRAAEHRRYLPADVMRARQGRSAVSLHLSFTRGGVHRLQPSTGDVLRRRRWTLENTAACKQTTSTLQAGDGDVLRRGRWTLEHTAARKQNVAVARLIRTSSWAGKPT